ncbi:hypothetical protein SRHO_G00237920 [Serrasalmus rhombeus]
MGLGVTLLALEMRNRVGFGVAVLALALGERVGFLVSVLDFSQSHLRAGGRKDEADGDRPRSDFMLEDPAITHTAAADGG